MITSADQDSLQRIVGATTFSRGKRYAERDAVKARRWEDGGTRVVGEVQGSASESYRVSATVTRSGGQRLSGIRASCTCPVGINCKHAVALLLSADSSAGGAAAFGQQTRDGGEWTAAPSSTAPSSTAPSSTAPSSPVLRLLEAAAGKRAGGSPSCAGSQSPADWEDSLRCLLPPQDHHVGAHGEAESPEVALQFELVDRPPAHRRAPVEQVRGVRLRPVVPGSNGRWVRSGISWSTLEYRLSSWRAGRRVTSERVSLLIELQALSRVGRPTPYSYSDEPVWLESVNSRRMWDLLAEAGELGLPLVGAGRDPAPVTLHGKPASVAVDLTKDGAGFTAQPLIQSATGQIADDRSLLIGRPGHGIAWWGQAPAAARQPHLFLAPLSVQVDDNLARLLKAGQVRVPEEDWDRFFGAFYPFLRRKLQVVSSDESVELPEVPEASLVLQLGHEPGHRLSLSWFRDDGIRRGLWDGLGPSLHGSPDQGAVEAVFEALEAVPDLSGLLESVPTGRRLRERAELEGMAAVRFSELVLPGLRRVPHLAVEERGTPVDYREAPSAPEVAFSGAESDDGDWLDLSVSVTVGGEEVPFMELFSALASEQSHLILPSGTYFSLRQPELAELAQLIAEARMLADSSGDRIRLSRFQASLWEDLCRLGVVSAQAAEWEASVRALASEDGVSEQQPPAGLNASLRPYQQAGFGWLSFLFRHSLGGILADDMGLGKTLQALALVCHAWEAGLADRPFLVVAPTSVVANWESECNRFTPGLGVAAITETSRRSGRPLADRIDGAAIVVTSYSLFRIDFEEYQRQGWSGLFLDEAQFVKNHRSRAYRCARMLPARFKVAMTGTPMENNLMELWSLLSVTSPGLFPSPERFGDYYRAPIEKGHDVDRLAQLRRRIRPLVLRRTKEQVVKELPPKQEQVLELDLSPRHKKLYQTYLHRERQRVLGLLGDVAGNRFQIFRSLNLLRQACLDISLVEPERTGIPSAKLDELMDMLSDVVADGHRVLVFSQFTRFLSLARTRISAAGIDHCYLDGRTRNRAAAIAKFREGEAPVFLISLKAGGFGLNLTEADYCILLDPWWNPATEAQAVDRVHRIGQERQVMIYRLVARGTIEEKVMALKAKKAALFANVVDSGAFADGSLAASDIQGLLG